MNYEENIIKGKLLGEFLPLLQEIGKNGYFVKGSLQDRKVILAHTILEGHYNIQNDQEINIMQKQIDDVLLHEDSVRHNWIEYLQHTTSDALMRNPVLEDSAMECITRITTELEHKKLSALFSQLSVQSGEQGNIDLAQYQANQVVLIKGESGEFDKYMTLKDIQFLKQQNKVLRIEIYSPFMQKGDDDSRLILTTDQLLDRIAFNQVNHYKKSLRQKGVDVLSLQAVNREGTELRGQIRNADGTIREIQINVGTKPGQQVRATTRAQVARVDAATQAGSNKEMAARLGQASGVKQPVNQSAAKAAIPASVKEKQNVQPGKQVQKIAGQQQSVSARKEFTKSAKVREQKQFEVKQEQYDQQKRAQEQDVMRKNRSKEARRTEDQQRQKRSGKKSILPKVGSIAGGAALANGIFNFI